MLSLPISREDAVKLYEITDDLNRQLTRDVEKDHINEDYLMVIRRLRKALRAVME
jgi:hypothetical protein